MIGELVEDAGNGNVRNPNGCKDGGTCHHDCRDGCFREKNCVPFSGSGLDDNWQLIE